MKQSDSIERIPENWRHGFQIGVGVFSAVIVVIEFLGGLPGIYKWLIRLHSDWSLPPSIDKDSVLNFLSNGAGGVSAVVGAIFTYLKK
jgi:hypothetical protein